MVFHFNSWLYIFSIKKKGDFYKYFSLLFFVLFLISVLVTGERSNTIKLF